VIPDHASDQAADIVELSWRVKSSGVSLSSEHVLDQMAEHKLHKSHLMQALDIRIFYERVVALGLSMADMWVRLELTQIATFSKQITSDLLSI
jgi:hypothetical protein